nr:helix-turn-helix domain-containing protein [Micrococcus luteus]
MSLRGVAQEAGVGVGTLYRHFPRVGTCWTPCSRTSWPASGGSCRPSSTGQAGTSTAAPRRGGGGSPRTWGP